MPFSSTFCLRMATNPGKAQGFRPKIAMSLDHVVITGKTTKCCVVHYMWKYLLIDYPHLGALAARICLSALLGGARSARVPVTQPSSFSRLCHNGLGKSRNLRHISTMNKAVPQKPSLPQPSLPAARFTEHRAPRASSTPSDKPAEITATSKPKEIGGPKGPEPTRFGDWERDGRCVDF